MAKMPHLATMEWDFKDQLHTTQQQVVKNSSGEATFYVYESARQRVRKVTESANGKRKKERIYLGGFEIYREYDETGNAVTLERETLHIMDDKQRIALVETRTKGDPRVPSRLIRFQFGNNLRSASLELDDKARIISFEEYTPYGSTSYQAVRSQTETPKRYRYTGKERDEESGLYYHGARSCAQWLGRWVSCDPASLIDGINLYRYVRDNPVGLIDPSGMYGWQDFNKDIGRANRALGMITGPLQGPIPAIVNEVTSKLTEAIIGKSAAKDGEPGKALSGSQRAEAGIDALIAATPAGAIQAASKAAGRAIGDAVVGKISKVEALRRADPTGITPKIFETAEALDRAEIASNSRQTANAVGGYVDAGLSFFELLEAGTNVVLTLRSFRSPTAAENPRARETSTPPPLRPGALSENYMGLPSPIALDPSFPDYNVGKFRYNSAEVSKKVNAWLGGSRDTKPLDKSSNTNKSLYEIEKGFGNRFYETTIGEAKDVLQQNNPGSRGLLAFGNAQSSHIVNVINFNGEVLAIDGQNMTYGTISDVVKNTG